MWPPELLCNLGRGAFKELKARRADEMDNSALAHKVVGDHIHGLIFLHAYLLGVDGHVADAVLVHAQGGVKSGLLLYDALRILEGVSEAIVELADARQMNGPFPIGGSPGAGGKGAGVHHRSEGGGTVMVRARRDEMEKEHNSVGSCSLSLADGEG